MGAADGRRPRGPSSPSHRIGKSEQLREYGKPLAPVTRRRSFQRTGPTWMSFLPLSLHPLPEPMANSSVMKGQGDLRTNRSLDGWGRHTSSSIRVKHGTSGSERECEREPKAAMSVLSEKTRRESQMNFAFLASRHLNWSWVEKLISPINQFVLLITSDELCSSKPQLKLTSTC